MDLLTNKIEKEAVIMLGLPLAGKSTWILENKDRFGSYVVVSADVYKETHQDYDPENVTEELHEWSVNEAENRMYELADLGKNIIMDTGGINNRYTIRVINNLQKKGYSIRLVHIKTPYEVCLERNKLNKRGRRVPEVAITDKALKEVSQFHKLDALCDNTEVYDYFTNKHIFIDMDGVIAAQSTLPIVNGEIDFVNGEIHRWQKPVTPVIEMLNELKLMGYDLYILSATANSTAYDEKQEWLDENFNLPRDRRFFVNQGRHKAEMLGNLRRKFKLEHRDVLLIDDVHTTLYDVKKRGMNSMHPSEFLTHDWEIEQRTFNLNVGEIPADEVDDYIKKVLKQMKEQPIIITKK